MDEVVYVIEVFVGIALTVVGECVFGSYECDFALHND